MRGLGLPNSSTEFQRELWELWKSRRRVLTQGRRCHVAACGRHEREVAGDILHNALLRSSSPLLYATLARATLGPAFSLCCAFKTQLRCKASKRYIESRKFPKGSTCEICHNLDLTFQYICFGLASEWKLQATSLVTWTSRCFWQEELRLKLEMPPQL